MNNQRIKKNYIYNLIYQIFGLITPLVTMPYISRVLGSAGVGQYSFSYSIVSYFVLFASLGFGHYAQREIARCQNNKTEQSKTFWEIIIARLVSVAISLLIFIITILTGLFNAYEVLMWILTINIISVAFDITFLYQGNENFGIISLRNVVIKIIGVIIIFLFVKDSDDVWVYTLCQTVILIISNISLWFGTSKYIEKVNVKELKIRKHFIPTIRLFIPTIAVSIYTILDKTLIGIIIQGETIVINEFGEEVIVKISDLENGYYDQSEKLVKMAITLFTSLGIVMTPRNSNEISNGNIENFRNNVNSALKFVCFLGTPLMFGMAATAFNFCPWFFGDGYEKVPYLIMMFCPIILIIGLNNVLGLQYLIPLKKDNKYTIAICSGAVINLILNTFMIYYLNSYGAAISTIIAETTITSIMFVIAKKDISFKKLFIDSWKFLFSGIVMFFIVYFTQVYLCPSVLNSMILIVEGIFIYSFLLIVLKENTLYSFIKKILKK